MYDLNLHDLRHLCLKLYPMPALDLFAQDLIDKPMLFYYRQTFEFLGGYCNCVHCAASSGDVLDLGVLGQRSCNGYVECESYGTGKRAYL